MTITEAKTNLRRPVTVNDKGELFNGKIFDIKEDTELVQVNFGDGNQGPFGWFCPLYIQFGWNGRRYDGPVFDIDEYNELVQVN